MPLVTAIYATPVAMEPSRTALDSYPQLEVIDVLDEGLLKLVLDAGTITPVASQRMISHLLQARAAGSDAVLVTCNIYSNLIGELPQLSASMPILPIDAPMVEAAVSTGPRIGVVATGRSGLDANVKMLEEAARRAARDIDLIPVLCEGAFGALVRGDLEAHDVAVRDAIEAFDDVDAVVLAQASMARVLSVPPVTRIPVLSSPSIAAKTLADLLI
jgi:hypothetical protein